MHNSYTYIVHSFCLWYILRYNLIHILFSIHNSICSFSLYLVYKTSFRSKSRVASENVTMTDKNNNIVQNEFVINFNVTFFFKMIISFSRNSQGINHFQKNL